MSSYNHLTEIPPLIPCYLSDLYAILYLFTILWVLYSSLCVSFISRILFHWTSISLLTYILSHFNTLSLLRVQLQWYLKEYSRTKQRNMHILSKYKVLSIFPNLCNKKKCSFYALVFFSPCKFLLLFSFLSFYIAYFTS